MLLHRQSSLLPCPTHPGPVFNCPTWLKWTDVVFLRYSVSESLRWGQQWGQILLVQSVSIPSVRPSLELPLTGSGNLV